MLKNHITIAFRNLWRNKLFSFINILGLAISFACVTTIFLWVNDELSFDKFHVNKSQIYKILIKAEGLNSDSSNKLIAVTPGKLVGAIKSEIPEVKYAFRINTNFRSPFKYKQKAFYEDKVFLVDNDFFKIFSFNIIKGNSAQPFTKLNDIVISKKIALKYFGNEDPIGKTLIGNSEYIVSAVFDNMPANSHLQMDILQSHMGSEKYWKLGYNWTNFAHETYIMINDNADPTSVSGKIEAILNKHNTMENINLFITLQPLLGIHLNPNIANSSALTSDIKYINIFSLIALGILLIACINFINISTANAVSRSKEIGVRKVLGSSKKNLIIQFMGEFAILTFIAAFFSRTLLEITLPYFNQFVGKELSLNLNFHIFFLAITTLTALLAGIYPAFFLSSFTPEKMLKNNTSSKTNRFSLRSVLVVFQFSISIFLITSTILVSTQLSFIQNKNLGFDKDNVLYILAKGNISKKFTSVKGKLLQYPNITSVSMKDCPPTQTVISSFVTWDKHEEKNLVLRIMQVTPDYFETMKIEATAGRVFSEDRATDKDAFVINRAAVQFLGIKSPIGKIIKTFGKKGEIIGVVNNTHFKSLHHTLAPLIFMPLPLKNYGHTAGSILIRFTGNDLKKVLLNIKSVWQAHNPDLPFEYHFLDQTIEQKYGFEQRLSKIFAGFSLLAIFISSLGLFALITFVALSRTKEIGIRKTLGASVTNIVFLLSIDFIKWALIANIIAWPIAWYFMNKWLQGFAYRVDISLLPFVFSGVLSLLIALLITGFQTVKAAVANPIESLKDE